MGDRCYMQITCRVQDKAKFEEWFPESFEPNDDGTIEMYSTEANYAYQIDNETTGDLPNDVPFVGWHDAGGEYTAAVFASDGKGNVQYRRGHGNDYLIEFDEVLGLPNPMDVAGVGQFIAFEKEVRKLLTPQ